MRNKKAAAAKDAASLKRKQAKKAVAAPAAEDEPEDGCFPRGGSVAARPLDQPEDSGGKDFLFSSAKPETPLRRKRREKPAEEQKPKRARKEKSEPVQRLSFSRLTVGTAVLGAVREARPTGLIVSLPNQLAGFVRYEEAAWESREETEPPALPSILPEGSLVLCVVTGMEGSSGNRRVELSTKPSMVNENLSLSAVRQGALVYGAVRSREDRGWLVDLGVHKLRGFVPDGAVDEPDQLVPGAPVLCVVTEKSSDAKAIVLTAKREPVLEAKLRKAAAFSALLPGMAVTCRMVEPREAGGRRGYHVTIQDGSIEASLDWQHTAGQQLAKGKDYTARVLCIDHESKQVSLTMDAALCALSPKPVPKKLAVGQVYEEATVTCVDEGVGISLDLPLKKGSFPAYAHISQASDEFVKSLSKTFKVGSQHRCRILGFNRLESVAAVTLKESVLDQPILTYADVLPGTVVDITVDKPVPNGIKVMLTDSISGFVPKLHVADKPSMVDKALLKFESGKQLKARVLCADPVKRTVILTLKKQLVGSEVPVLSSYEDAVPGSAYHGFISSARDKGLFVSFCNNVFGLIRAADLDAYAETGAVPKVGATVKVWLQKVKKNNQLQFGLTPVEAGGSNTQDRSLFDSVAVGEIRPGVVSQVLSTALVVSIGKGVNGILPNNQLSDHPSMTTLLAGSLAAGMDLGDLVVLEKDDSKRKIVLSCKHSLVAAMKRGDLPSSIEDVQQGHIYSGYINNVTKYGAFVGFAGGLSGLAHKRELADAFVADPSEHFTTGNSVNAKVSSLDDGKMSLNLKLSECPSHHDAPAPVLSYFEDRELAEQLAIKSAGTAVDNEVWDQLQIGSLTDAQVMSVHSYGAVLSLLGDVVGFIKTEQLGGQECEPGETLQCKILDVSKDKTIVDLSLKLADPEAGATHKPKKRKRSASDLAVGSKVNAVVELVKEDYLVVSLPEGNVGFALSHDFNNRAGEAHDLYSLGKKLKMKVVRHAPPNRLLLQIDHQLENAQKPKKKREECADPEVEGVSDIKIGMLTKAKVKESTGACINVVLGRGIKGRIQISHYEGPEAPSEGTVLDVRVLSKCFGKSGRMYELSALPSVLNAEELPRFNTIDNLKQGKQIVGYVDEISDTGDSMSIWINPLLRGRMTAEESSPELSVASDLDSNFSLGQKIRCYVVKVDPQRNHLDLSMLPPKQRAPIVGSIRLAVSTRSAKSAGGLYLRVAGGVSARAYLTDLLDQYVPNPVENFSAGTLVQCKVLAVNKSKGGAPTLDVTVRESQMDDGEVPDPSCPALDSVSDIKQGDLVQGYVKTISAKGCFVGLARHITARVKLGDLSDGFIKDPAAEFPVGTLVKGRIQMVDDVNERIDMCLKPSMIDPSHEAIAFEDVEPGMLLSGVVKKVEDFGVFVNLDESAGLSGLCHLSEVSEQYIKNVKKAYSPGDKVKVAVIRVNPSNKHISLSMKQEHFEDEEEEDDDEEDEDEEEEDDEETGLLDENGMLDAEEDEDEDIDELQQEDDEEDEEMAGEEEEDEDEDEDEEMADGEDGALAASKLQWDGFDLSGPQVEAEEESDDEEANSDDDELPDSKTTRRKKKQRLEAEHEAEVQAREAEAMMGDAAPETVADFERLVLEHPNSSYVWIKFIAFHVTLTEVDQARTVAQKALDKISSVEGLERMQVWNAWMNLEHKFGDLKGVLDVAQKAANNMDAKEVYMRLLNIYDGDPDPKVADEVYKMVSRKLKSSSQIWLKYCVFKLKNGWGQGARNVLQQALTATPKRKHVGVLSKFAQLEFKHGSAERGRTMFDSLLASQPKRLDLWHVWLQCEIKQGDLDTIRALFEKVCAMLWSSKKMKFLLKMYLSFEKTDGTEDGVDRVREIATQYVDNKT